MDTSEAAAAPDMDDMDALPPVAERREHADVYHGEAIADPYHWLRERENPAVRAYLEAENAYTEAVTAPIAGLRDALYTEMLGRIQQTDLSVPVRRGSYWYFTRTKEDLQYPIFCRCPASDGDEIPTAEPNSALAGEQILLDQNELAAGLAFCSLGAFEVSDDARRLAYTVDTTGMRRYRLAVKDLETGAMLADTAERVTSVEWASDSSTLFYVTEDATTKRSDRLFRHPLGSGAGTEIYHEPDELYSISVQRTRDRQYMLLSIGATDSWEVRYWPADEPASAPKLFRARERDHKYDIDHREGRFYVRSNQGAKNFKIFTVPAADPAWEKAEPFLAHDPEVLLEGLDLFATHAVAIEKSAALTRLRVYSFADRRWQAIEFPEPVYMVFPAGNPEFNPTHYRYSYQSMVTPASVFDYDFNSGVSVLRKQQPVLGGYDRSRYASARLWATASDGVRVPLSAVWRKRTAGSSSPAEESRPTEPRPLLLYGYGAYGIGMEAGFSIARLSLLDRGVVFVIAHIRGGNDMGEAWHDDGMLMKKRNTFTDFIACARHLIRDGWTEPDQLAIEGGSAGGLLIGAVLNLCPELFRAAHLAVPFVDVINSMMDETLPLTVGEYLEWGDPRQKAAYDYMRSYCPYTNLAPRPYPAMLVTTGLNDSQVMYWEPAKYTAKLRAIQAAQPGEHAPLLLKTNLGAGHGGASGRYDKLHETAFEYAWLLNQLGATEPTD